MFVKRRRRERKEMLPLLMLLLFGMLLLQQTSLRHSSPFIHTEVLKLMREGGEGPVFIVSETLPAVQAERIWRFGRYYIAKAYLRAEEMKKLLHTNVLSIYPEMVLAHPDALSSYQLLGFDVKTVVHQPSGQWCGRDVSIAIIDTGVDYLHPDLVHAIHVLVSVTVLTKEGKPIIWINGVNGSLDAAWALDQYIFRNYGVYAWMDEDGHGTHVTGIIASRSEKYPGLASCSRIIMVKAFSGEGGRLQDALNALEWVYNNVETFGIRVLSISWGAAVPSDGRDPLSIACDAIAEKGVLVFAAAGNNGNLPNTILAPAAARLVYAVGAWDGYTGKIAPFSSLGPTVDGRMKPDIYAVGVLVVSTRSRLSSVGIAVGEKYAALSGTSMAAPAAAACAANFIEMFKSWNKRYPTRSDWEVFLFMNSKRFNPFFKDFVTGWGVVSCP